MDVHRRVSGWFVSLAAAAVACVSVLTPVACADDEIDAPAMRVGVLEIEGTPLERPHPLAWLFDEDEEPTLLDLCDQIRFAAGRDDLDGVLIRLKDDALTLSQAEELAEALDLVRDSGKTVAIYGESLDTTAFVLSRGADWCILQKGGDVSLPGMYMEELYLADALGWAGLKADMVQVGDYKGAADPMSRSAPSAEWDRNINGLLDGLYAAMRDDIKTARDLDDAGLDAAMKDAWLADAATAERVGLVDADVDWPKIESYLSEQMGGSVKVRPLKVETAPKAKMENPFAMFSMLTREPPNKPTRPTIAVVHIDGPIVDGESTDGGFMGERSVGSRTIRRILQELESNKLVEGVVLRIDSPGGSAVASEIIWQGVRNLSEKKPVWVSVGSMAASGGYYIAVSSSKIYVNPASIVGSIGVVGGKLAKSELMQKLKVNMVPRTRGPMGGILASSAPFTPDQREAVRQKMAETYELFTRRVSAGREGIDLKTTAEGRLFAGRQAIEKKMADEVGGLQVAIEDMADELALEPGEYDVMHYPGAQSLQEVLENLFGGFAASARAPVSGAAVQQAAAKGALVSLAKEILGEAGFAQVRDSVGAMMQLRTEPVLLISPSAIIVR